MAQHKKKKSASKGTFSECLAEMKKQDKKKEHIKKVLANQGKHLIAVINVCRVKVLDKGLKPLKNPLSMSAAKALPGSPKPKSRKKAKAA